MNDRKWANIAILAHFRSFNSEALASSNRQVIFAQPLKSEQGPKSGLPQKPKTLYSLHPMNKDTQNRPFVTTLPKEMTEKLKMLLEEQGFSFTIPPYTLYSAKKKGLSVTLYASMKLCVQGKEMAEFIEYHLEPEILKTFSFTHPTASIDQRARIGVDEAGKGDFFGALCIASVFAESEAIEKLAKLGVRDSKNITDSVISKLCKAIKEHCQYEVIQIGPERYNTLYKQFKNLNSLLAWGHATAIEKLSTKSGCTVVIVDKFAHEYVVENALKRKKLNITPEQKVRAESDIVVAAASILARGAFLQSIEALSKAYEMEIPKGASSKVISAGKKLVAKFGPGILEKVAKTHFRTTDSIIHA